VITINPTEYRAMAAEQHRFAGMCRSPKSRQQHLRLEREFLVLAGAEDAPRLCGTWVASCSSRTVETKGLSCHRYRLQSSSASRFTAGAFGFLLLIQRRAGRELQRESFRFDTMPSSPSEQP
jgi:hypothetical protein